MRWLLFLVVFQLAGPSHGAAGASQLEQLLATKPRSTQTFARPSDFERACDEHFPRPIQGSGPAFAQYIWNGVYQWRELRTIDGIKCIYLLTPEERFLSAEEALLFEQASSGEFPVPTNERAGSELINPHASGDPNAELCIRADGALVPQADCS